MGGGVLSFIVKLFSGGLSEPRHPRYRAKITKPGESWFQPGSPLMLPPRQGDYSNRCQWCHQYLLSSEHDELMIHISNKGIEKLQPFSFIMNALHIICQLVTKIVPKTEESISNTYINTRAGIKALVMISLRNPYSILLIFRYGSSLH